MDRAIRGAEREEELCICVEEEEKRGAEREEGTSCVRMSAGEPSIDYLCS